MKAQAVGVVNKQTNRIFKTVIPALLFALVQWIPGTATAQGEVAIGAILPLSGRLEATGKAMRTALELVADIANRDAPGLSMSMARWQGIPGLGGAKVRLVFADHRSDPARGAELAGRLISEEKVAGILGCYNSTVTKSVSSVCEKMKSPMITSTSTAQSLTTQGNKWLWRTTPHNIYFARDFFLFLKTLREGRSGISYQVAAEEIGTLALAGEDSELGDHSVELLKNLAPRYGIKPILSVRYGRNSEDLSIQTRALSKAGPGVLAMISRTSDAVLYIRTFKELGFSPKIIWGHNAGYREPAFAEDLKEDALGVLVRADFLPSLLKTIPLARQINDLYRAKTGRDLDGVSSRAFTGLQAFLHILDKAGSTVPSAVQAAANAIEIPATELIMPWKGIRFGGEQQNEAGQNVLASGLAAQWHIKEETGRPELEVVYPPQFATAELMYPFPEWKK
jgi:branched-chain amino acid transport system substrate-binding protein